jgi:hypothetical protein
MTRAAIDGAQLRLYLIEHRSYWIPGSYAPALSEKHNAFLRPLKNKGFKEESRTKFRGGRYRHVHDPGIQQEPLSNEQIAHELSLNESDAYQMTTALRGGIVKKSRQ